MKILSGIRSSGKLHLGNYLGAIKNWIDLQNHPALESAIYMIADYHGITTPFDPKTYGAGVMDVACQFLAAGLDTNKVSLIRQSRVPQHTELAWIFNTITPVSWLERLPTYKEQLEKSSKYNHMGLLDYPVLMAADILIYKADTVPVGEDQSAHIDLTNEIAKKFNSMFGETFKPVKINLTAGARIMSLQEPTKKMSKTGDEGIALSDSPDAVRDKIKRAVTDSGSEIKFDEENKPAISNLLTIYSLLANEKIADIESRYAGKTYSDFKSDLAEVVVNFLQPFQEKYNEFNSNLTEVEKILTKSEEKAKEIASSTLTEVKQSIGIE
ncbi:MAG TPA: tryptophan--tRNA ligase [Candidatus Paceibacterota bacterium]|nr:tryptophan--tRNA ligase [Candidatus Paceibacterota bacterium]